MQQQYSEKKMFFFYEKKSFYRNIVCENVGCDEGLRKIRNHNAIIKFAVLAISIRWYHRVTFNVCRGQSFQTCFFVKQIFFCYQPWPFQSKFIIFFCYEHSSLTRKWENEEKAEIGRIDSGSMLQHADVTKVKSSEKSISNCCLRYCLKGRNTTNWFRLINY